MSQVSLGYGKEFIINADDGPMDVLLFWLKHAQTLDCRELMGTFYFLSTKHWDDKHDNQRNKGFTLNGPANSWVWGSPAVATWSI